MKREDFHMVITHAICCGGILLFYLGAAYGSALIGVVLDNALLVALGLAGLGAGATLLLSRRRARDGCINGACSPPQPGERDDQKGTLTQGRQSPGHL